MSTLGNIKELYANGFLDDDKMFRLVRLGAIGNAVGISVEEFEEATGKSLESVISLEDAKTLLHGVVNGKRETARNELTATYDNDEFEVNRTSQSNITSVAAAALMAVQAGKADQIFVYRSATNTDHSFTATQILELALVLVDKVQSIYDESWELKNKIDAATTVSEAFAVLSTSTDSTDTTEETSTEE